jgi:hypothetical protein
MLVYRTRIASARPTTSTVPDRLPQDTRRRPKTLAHEIKPGQRRQKTPNNRPSRSCTPRRPQRPNLAPASGLKPCGTGGNDAIPPDDLGWRKRPRQPPGTCAGHGRRCGIEEQNVRRGRDGVNTLPCTSLQIAGFPTCPPPVFSGARARARFLAAKRWAGSLHGCRESCSFFGGPRHSAPRSLARFHKR